MLGSHLANSMRGSGHSARNAVIDELGLAASRTNANYPVVRYDSSNRDLLSRHSPARQDGDRLLHRRRTERLQQRCLAGMWQGVSLEERLNAARRPGRGLVAGWLVLSL